MKMGEEDEDKGVEEEKEEEQEEKEQVLDKRGRVASLGRGVGRDDALM